MKKKIMAFSPYVAGDVTDSDTEVPKTTTEFDDQQLTDVQPETSEATDQPVIYRWEIRNFSQLGPQMVESATFSAGGLQWKIILFPRGDGTDHLSLYLKTANAKSLPFVHLKLTVINQNISRNSLYLDLDEKLNEERCLGSKHFMPLGDLLDPAQGFLVDDVLRVKAEVRCKSADDSSIMETGNKDVGIEDEVNSGTARKYVDYLGISEKGDIYDWIMSIGHPSPKNLGAEHHHKENSTRYLGMSNHGFTCYMNSFIQTLYHIPCFRKAIYQFPTTKDQIPCQSTLLALQRLFYMLQFGKGCVSTIELAKSFGSRWQSFVMQDIHEFCRFLSSELEEKMKGTVVEGTMEKLFQLELEYTTKCLNVDYESTTSTLSYELILPVEGCTGVYASFDKIVGPQPLDEQLKTETHGKQDAEGTLRFTHFPPVLQLVLSRFNYESANDNAFKINDYYEFPTELNLDQGDGKYLSSKANRNIQNHYILYSVLAHIGNMSSGHYYAYIRPTLSDEWYKFDDETVTKENAHDAVEGQFGCKDKGSMRGNAYMLVYIRESDKDYVMCSVEKEDLPQHLEERLLEEQTKAYPRRRQLGFQDTPLPVLFRPLAGGEGFTLFLAESLSYAAVVERVAEHLDLDGPSRIELTSHNSYTKKPNFKPIPKFSASDLRGILGPVNELLATLYYKVLDIPPEETEGFKSLQIKFLYSGTIDKVDTHTIRMPTASTVGDSLDILKTKVGLSHLGADLRMFEVFGHKIYKVFSPDEKIADLNDQYITLQAEEIPEDEKNLSPKGRMIRVYHYADDTQIKVFGHPFFLVIHAEERFADIKLRLRKKTGVSDTEFASWRFAFLGLGNPEYLEDSDILMCYFEREEKNTSIAWQPFLGIHRTDESKMDVD